MTSGTNILYSLGNVGIGGIDALYKFTVAGSTTMGGLLNVNAAISADNLYIVGQAGIGGFNDGSCKLFVNGLIKSDGTNVNGLMKSNTIHTDEFQLCWGNAIFSIRNSQNPTLQTFQGLPLIINPVGLNRVGIGDTNPRAKLDVQGNIVATNENGAITFWLTNIVCTNRIDCGRLVATYRVFPQNNVYVNNLYCPSISYLYSSVTEYNRSRQINIPIRATNTFIFSCFSDIGSHTLFIKEGNS